MSAADWSLPGLGSNYTDVLSYLKSRDEDAANMFHDAATNVPTNAVKYNRSSNKFQYWDSAAWQDLVLAIAGGGTGGSTTSAARTALGLGTLATQNDSAVAITGGTIAGVTMDASVINSGTLPLNRGGTSASLALGSAGKVLRVNNAASAVEFNDVLWANVIKTGSSLADLATRSAGDLSSGTLPLARLSGITTSQMASAAISQFTNDSAYVTASIINALNASNLTSGTVPLARLSGITNSEIAAGAAIVYSKLSLSGSIVNGDIVSLAGSKVSGDIAGNAANINNYTINQSLGTGNSPTFATVNATYVISLGAALTGALVSAESGAWGAGAITGSTVFVGRNSSGNGAPGAVEFITRFGSTFFLWVDQSGNLRFGSSQPTEGSGDTGGTIIS